jgi:ADP-ribose pyrophosphatase YjhB (NUDIX family)
MEPRWLEWAKRLQAIAQDGITYTKDHYDVERYTALREVAAEIIAYHAEADLTHVRDLLGRETGPATPKLDVRAAVFKDDRILLVKEPSDGRWSLPGGWADVNESAAEAVVREVFEESGYRTRAVKLVALYDRNKHPHPPYLYHAYKVFFQCDLLDANPADVIDSAGVGFFRADALPEFSLTRVLPGQIARLFEHYRNPSLPAEFD